jgi:thymidylate synthase (FAD)
MVLSPQSIELWKQTELLPHVERCGRLCYKSNNRQTTASYVSFISHIVKLEHFSVLEHGSVYLKVWEEIDLKSAKSPYSKVVKSDKVYYLYTNLRVIIENDRWLFYLIQNLKPGEHRINEGIEFFEPEIDDPYRRFTFLIKTDNFISRELVRHRAFSFSQESSRYVNYNKRGMGFIDMSRWLTKKQNFWWKLAAKCSEFFYNKLIKNGAQPQMARSVLLASGETNLAMTGSLEQWQAFFKLRCDRTAHPQVREIAYWIQNDLKILTEQ